MKYFFLFCIILFMVGCSKNQSATIPKEKMVDVIYDLTLSSSARNTYNRLDTIQYVVSYESILQKYGLDSLQFVAAQNEYRKNPEVIAGIYESVSSRLRKELGIIRATKPTEEELLPAVDLNDLEEIPHKQR